MNPREIRKLEWRRVGKNHFVSKKGFPQKYLLMPAQPEQASEAIRRDELPMRIFWEVSEIARGMQESQRLARTLKI